MNASPESLIARSGRKLETPNAPYMQQLLVSEHLPGKGWSSKCIKSCSTQAQFSNEAKETSNSVLRNLLVSGHDDSEGHYVLQPSSLSEEIETPPTPRSLPNSSEVTLTVVKSSSKSEPIFSSSPPVIRCSPSSSPPVIRCSPRKLKHLQPSPPSTSSNSADSSSCSIQLLKGYRKIIPSSVLKTSTASCSTNRNIKPSIYTVSGSESSFVQCQMQSPAVSAPSFSLDSNSLLNCSSAFDVLTDQPTLLVREADTIPCGSMPFLFRKANSGNLRLVRLTAPKSRTDVASNSGLLSSCSSSRGAPPRRPHTAAPNSLRYANILPKVLLHFSLSRSQLYSFVNVNF